MSIQKRAVSEQTKISDLPRKLLSRGAFNTQILCHSSNKILSNHNDDMPYGWRKAYCGDFIIMLTLSGGYHRYHRQSRARGSYVKKAKHIRVLRRGDNGQNEFVNAFASWARAVEYVRRIYRESK